MEPFAVWVFAIIFFFVLPNQPQPPSIVKEVAVTPKPPPTIKETAILLPSADGKSSGIVIKSMGQEVAITVPYQAIELSAGRITSKTVSADEIQQLFPEVMQALPDPPISFTLRFESNGATLTPASAAMIDEIRQEIIKRDVPEVTVIGHTDRKGSNESNLLLSLSRAESVRDILIAGNVSRQIIQVVSRGELEPEVVTEDNVAEPLNRRVEISVR